MTRVLARALDVDLTLHAPYYVDFFGSADAREQSTRQIQWAGVLAHGLGARLAVTHLGFYGTGDRGDSIQSLTEIVYGPFPVVLPVHAGQGPARHRAERASGRFRFPRGGPRAGATDEGDDRPGPQPPPPRRARAEELRGARRSRPDPPRVREGDQRSAVPQLLRCRVLRPRRVPPHADQARPGAVRPARRTAGGARLRSSSVISSSPLLEHDAMYMKLLYERALARRWTKAHPAPTPKGAAKPSAKAPVKPAQRPPAKPARPAAAPAAKGKAAAHRRPSRPPARSRPTPSRSSKPRPKAKGGTHGRRSRR